MFTTEELEYIKKFNLVQLTFSIPAQESLFQTIHGAHTVSRAMELDKLHSSYHSRMRSARSSPPVVHKISWELGIQNERCIEQHGCSMFTFW